MYFKKMNVMLLLVAVTSVTAIASEDAVKVPQQGKWLDIKGNDDKSRDFGEVAVGNSNQLKDRIKGLDANGDGIIDEQEMLSAKGKSPASKSLSLDKAPSQQPGT